MLRIRLAGGAAFAIGLTLAGNANAQKLKTLYSFTGGADGGQPESALVDQGGFLYGTADDVVFKVNPKTGAETVLHTFSGGADGAEASGKLVYQGGFLYGVTAEGGGAGCPGYGCGTVFKIELSTGVETVIYSFGGGADGQTPTAGLVYEKGTLYGTTYRGGNSGNGTVFRVNANTGAEAIIHSFGGSGDGNSPLAGLLYQGGVLYGTTSLGGKGGGTLFSITPKNGKEHILYSFGSALYDGESPAAGVIYEDGILYGTTYSGGGSTFGTVFAFDTTSRAETVLYSFSGTSDGAYPLGDLVYENGLLYGTTSQGSGVAGTIFNVDPVTGAQTTVYGFTEDKDGGEPYAGLFYQGNAFYGTTRFGGTGNSDSGTVFKFTP